MANRTVILKGIKVQQKIERMVHQIIEEFYGEKQVTIIGIKNKGAQLSRIIKAKLEEINPFDIEYFELKLDKDNCLDHPIVIEPKTETLSNKRVILIDDVVNSGRTMIYATRYILGEPVKSLTTLCMVDRIHRRFPIKVDIVGQSLSTTLQEHILMDLKKGKEAIYLE
jgi:pyrimidine operon attenuation protein/uracil phosphoribosyltransferase